MLRCETNTPAVEASIMEQASGSQLIKGIHRNLSTAFEHGQWWVSCLDCWAQWSVNDAVVDGENMFSFEEVAHGDGTCLDNLTEQSRENENCLAGMKCPECGSLGPYRIEVSTVIQFSDEGEDFINDKGSNQEWQDDSYCECTECQFAGKIRDFQIDKEDKPAQPSTAAPTGQKSHAEQRAYNQVLAALRFWQKTFPRSTMPNPSAWSEYFSDEGYLPMGTDEIDTLCEIFDLVIGEPSLDVNMREFVLLIARMTPFEEAELWDSDSESAALSALIHKARQIERNMEVSHE